MYKNETNITQIKSNGVVLIPSRILKETKLNIGDEVSLDVSMDTIRIKKIRSKTILDLAGIAKGRAIGKGNERKFTKKLVAKKINKTSDEKVRNGFR